MVKEANTPVIKTNQKKKQKINHKKQDAMKTSNLNLRNLVLAAATSLLFSSMSLATTATSSISSFQVISQVSAQGIKAVSAVPCNDGTGNWLVTCINGKKVVAHYTCGILSIMVDPG